MEVVGTPSPEVLAKISSEHVSQWPSIYPFAVLTKHQLCWGGRSRQKMASRKEHEQGGLEHVLGTSNLFREKQVNQEAIPGSRDSEDKTISADRLLWL